MSSRTRRSTRQRKTPHWYNDDNDNDDEENSATEERIIADGDGDGGTDEEAHGTYFEQIESNADIVVEYVEEPVPKRRRGRAKRESPKTNPSKNKRKAANASTDSDSGSLKEPLRNNAKRRKDHTRTKIKVSLPSNQRKDSSMPKKNECPHCGRNFCTTARLNYHINNFVCRPSEKLKSENHSQRDQADTRKVEVPSKKVATKNYCSRGAAEDRTCSNCNRVFSSIPGLEYHVQKKVCVKAKERSNIPFDTLQAGDCFSTVYGVVQVVQDNRAIPTAELASDVKKRLKIYCSAKTKQEQKQKKLRVSIAIANRARRSLVMKAYTSTTGTESDASSSLPSAMMVAKAYSAARGVCHKIIVDPQQRREDPMAPQGSNPDRIVECVLIPDERPRFILHQTELVPLEGLAAPATASSSKRTAQPTRMFLQRRLLTNEYKKVAQRLHCPLCFQCFLSKPGCRYHIDSGACARKRERDAADKAELLATIDARAQETVNRGQDIVVVKVTQPLKSFRRETDSNNRSTIAEKKTDDDGDHNDNNNNGGKRFVESEDYRDESGKFAGPRSKKKKIPKTTVLDENEEIVSPDDVLARLKDELYVAQGAMIGPMYPSVWKALGFQKPKPPKRKRKTKKEREKEKEEQRLGEWRKAETARLLAAVVLAEQERADQELEMEPAIDSMERKPPDLHPPCTVDTRVLVAEVDAGRYPSIKRYSGRHNDRVCYICKENPGEQKFLKCDFCKNCVHFPCVLTRFVIKEPEPQEDFMCHTCIGVLIARRNRAEKRRLEKLPEVPTSKETTEMSRFDEISAQGHRVEELTEILRDAKMRLGMSVKFAAMTRVRRSMMRDYEGAGSVPE